MRTCRGRSNPVEVSTNLVAPTPPLKIPSHPGQPPASYLTADYMDNMDNAITNEKDVLEQLVDTNSNQASTITTQATTILSLSYEVKIHQLRITNRSGRSGRGGKSNNVTKFLKDGS